MLKRSALALAIGTSLLAAPLFAEARARVLAQIEWTANVVAFCSLSDTSEGRCKGTYKGREEGSIFGGLSGIEVDRDGQHFTAISDTGMAYSAAFKRNALGNISSAHLLKVDALLFENAQRPEEKFDRDTEGLAYLNDTQVYISAESNVRLLRYDQGNSQPHIASLPKADARAPTNMGFEALAIDADGALFALPEGSPNIRSPFNLFQRTDNGTWNVVYQVPRRGGFRPVGADFGADGHLYVLFRAFNGFGFASQIHRVLFEGGKPADHQQLFSSKFGQFDNLEGLSTWQAGPNDLRLYAVSDDNFSKAQSTVIVEFQIDE